MRMLRAALLSMALFAPFIANGALEWESDHLEFQRKASDGAVEVCFRYKNSGTTPVVIKNVEASCSCTTAEVTKSVVNPGQSGELRALFTFGKRVGLQRKVIVVETDDSVVKELRFKVEIADRVKVEPTTLRWEKGSNGVQKVMVYAQDGYVIPQIRAVPTDRRLTATVKTVTRGEVYEVEVAKAKAGEPFTAKLRVETALGTPLAGVKIIPVTVE